MNAISTLTQLPSTPNERRLFIEIAKQEITEGKYRIIDIFTQLRNIEKLIEELTKDTEFRDMLSTAINGKIEINGMEISEQIARKYNCAECHDSTYDHYLSQMNELKAKIKAREEFLKAIPVEGVVVPDTGEVIYPPVATYETRFIVKPVKK